MSVETPMARGPVQAHLNKARVSRGLEALRVSALRFVQDLRDPPYLVAFLSSLFVVVASIGSVLLGDPNAIRAHAPPPPTKVQIQQAQETALTFSTTPPAERGDVPQARK